MAGLIGLISDERTIGLAVVTTTGARLVLIETGHGRSSKDGTTFKLPVEVDHNQARTGS
jgi:hypothetical protein